jgi:type II secretion system protein N
MNLELPERYRRPAKWVGYPLFAFVVFMIALYASLPRARIQDRLQTDASTWLNADVKADGFGLTLLSGPGVSADSVVVATRPLLPGDKVARYSADDVVIHFSLFQLLRGFADASFRGAISGGQLEGRFKSVPEEGLLQADASGLDLAKLPGVASLGVPIDGKIDAKVDVTTPKNLAAQANGSIKLELANASVGDGKAKLVIPGGDPFLSQGVTLPKISLGTLSGSVSIEKGRATFRDVRAHSRDVDLELDGYIELRDPVSLSVVHAYLKFKPSDALTKREGTIDLMQQMLGPTAKRPDGFLGFTINGTLAGVFFLPSKDAPPGVGRDAGVAGVRPPPPVTPVRLAAPGPAPTVLPPPPVNYDVPAPPPPAPVQPPPEAVAPPPALAAPSPAAAVGSQYHNPGLRAVGADTAGSGAPPPGHEVPHEGAGAREAGAQNPPEGEGRPVEGEQQPNPPPPQ